MTREDLFKAIGMMDEERLAKCKTHRNTPADTPMEDMKMSTYKGYSYRSEGRKTKKLWLLAAVIGVLALLVGSLTVIQFMLANAFTRNTALTDISQLTQEQIHLSVDEDRKSVV